MKLRRLFLWIHLVAGLAAAIVLVLLGVTGAVMVFETEIDHMLNARLYHLEFISTPARLDDLVARIEKTQNAKVTSLQLPAEAGTALTVGLRMPDGKTSGVTVDPTSGAIIGALSTANTFTQKLHQFHKNLLLGEKGKLITGWGAILLIVLSVTGLILWWPRKLWKFSKGATKSGRRTNFDLHNVLGFYSSVFMLIFGVTGVVIHWDDEATRLVQQVTGTPSIPPVPSPSPSAPDAKFVTFSTARDAALKAAPGAKVVWIQGIGDSRKPIRVSMRFPEDRTPIGRTTVYLHPATGEVLLAQTSRTGPLSFRLVRYWNRQLHTGDTLGWTSRIIACLASLSLPLLAVTGPLIWWGRIKRRRDVPDVIA